MGHLGWTEYQYYTSSPEAVQYALEGYFDKRAEEEGWFRAVWWPMYCMAGGKGTPQTKWPIRSDPRAPVLTPEEKRKRYEKIAKKYNVVAWQKN